MSGARVLVVEDEAGLSLTLGDRLRAEGFEVQIAADGEAGLEALRGPDVGASFDVVVLDVMLPGIDGFAVCRELRRSGLDTPVLMLTARAEVRDRVAGLRMGADDYLTKPFDPDELVARLEALLRRAGERRPEAPRRFGDVEVDLRGRSVTRGGREVELSAMEFQLLSYMMRHDGEALSRERILREVWGFQRAPRTRTVDVHVTWLRRKLEPDRADPRHIRTVRGVGYKFVAEAGGSAGPG